MARVRWGGVAFGLIQVLTYYRPYPPGAMEFGLALVLLLAAGNLAVWATMRRVATLEMAQRVSLLSLSFDVGVVMGFVFTYTFDQDTAIWALIYILPLEGAIRFQLKGAVGTMGCAAAIYAGREVYGSAVFENDLLLTSISFRMGIGFIVAAVGGTTASSLLRGQEELVLQTQAVSESEHLLAQMERIAKIGTWEWDFSSGRIDWSDEMYRIYGFEAQTFTVTFDKAMERVAAEDIPRIAENVERALALGDDHDLPSIDYGILLPGGEERMLHGKARLFFESGRAVRMVGTVEDVTELARAQLELQTQKELYETLLGAASEAGEGVAIVSMADLRFLWVNQAVSDLFGYTEEELLALPSALVLADPSEVRPIESRGLRQAEGSLGEDFETIGIRKDSSRVHLEVSSRRLDATRSMALFRDISGRKQAEQELRASEERTRLVIETATDAFIAMDPEGIIRDWNRQSEVTFGWVREDAVGRKMVDTIMPARYRAAHKTGMERFLATGEGPIIGERVELSAVHRDGHEFPIELTVWAREVDGTYAFNAFVHDISERKQAEAAMQAALDRESDAAQVLREADQMKDEFLSLVTHDLKTPLTVIIGLSETLLLRPDRLGVEDSKDILNRIKRQGELMNTMVAQLLDLSRLEAGVLELRPEVTRLRPLIDEVVDQLQPALGRHKVAIDASPEVDVKIDRAGFERILVNLLTNAAKYSPAGTSIDVKVETAEGEARVSIRDRGRGIPPESLSRIFERFYRVPGGAAQGTGVGLTVASRYVEAMGGRIWVDSVPGEGSTFSFTLPLAGRDQVMVANPAPVSGSTTLD